MEDNELNRCKHAFDNVVDELTFYKIRQKQILEIAETQGYTDIIELIKYYTYDENNKASDDDNL